MTAPTSAVVASSKPALINELRSTWRASREHKVAQVKRFVSALVGVVALNVVSDISANKDPLAHVTDTRTAWYYLLPLAWVAWRQLHPALTASQVDSAPGATIVPAQVGASPAVAPGADPASAAVAGVPDVDTDAPGEAVDLEDVPDDLPAGASWRSRSGGFGASTRSGCWCGRRRSRWRSSRR